MKKLDLFWKIYLAVVGVCLIGIVAVWVVLWSFLSAYEKSRAEKKMDQVVKYFNNEDVQTLSKYLSYEVSALETGEDVERIMENYIQDTISESEWTYTKKLGEYTENAPVYAMKKDGVKTDIIVRLSKSAKKGKHNMPIWQLDSIEGMEKEPDTHVFIVPKGSKVIYNNTELDASYITKDDIEDSTLVNVDKYIDAPKLTEYTVSGVYSDFSVMAKGPVMGSVLNISTNEADAENVMRFGFESNEEFNDSVEERIIEITEIYGNYVINNVRFGKLSPYIYKDSYAYTYLSKVSGTNIWYEVAKDPEFDDMEVYNYQSYTDDCFSCEVKFTEKVTYTDGYNEYPTHLQYIFLKRNSKWLLADIIMKKG